MRPLVLAALLAPLLAAPTVDAQPSATVVEVGVYILNLGNHDVNKGTYLLDFYLVLSWDGTTAPAGFTPEKLEFMNGRATARERISDETDPTTGWREVWYRIQANLYSEPRFERFPFDTQNVEILFEDAISPREELVYVVNETVSGVDEGFRAAGWRTGEPRFDVVTKDYAFGESYSRASFGMELSRERFSTSIKSMLPPIAFVLVAALSFVIHPSKWSNRVGLGTGMLISSVMFHISQTVALPPMPDLILFDKIMIAVYAFVIGSLVVTTLVAIDEDYWKTSDHTKQINVYGALATTLLSAALLVFLL